MTVNPPWADKKLTKEQRGHMAFRYEDWLLTKNIPSGGFRLLYAILQCLNEVNQFHCFPSIDYLAALIKRHPSTVWEMLPKLEKIGVIEIEWGSQGSRHPNTYRLPAAFLELYFGPTKGRQPKPDPVPKKPGQTSVSKPGQTRVSNASETRAQGQKNPGLTPGKPGQTRESHLLATSSHKKERGAQAHAAQSARVERGNVTETETTVSDAPLNPANTTVDAALNSATDRLVPRADDRAIQPADQAQLSPSRPSQDMGRPADAARAAFADVSFAWPSDRTDDEGYAAYVAALAAAQGDTEVVLDAIWERLEESGADPPWLSDALRRIEHDLRYGNPARGAR